VHHLENEENGERMRREVVVHPGAVVVLPLLEGEKVLLIRNRRYAVGQVLLELPAGTLEKGEDPMNCAGRELLEETGYLAGRLRVMASFFSSPGVLTEKMHAFIAYDLREQAQALEEGEEIELAPVELSEAIEMIGDGRIQDAKTIVTLLMYERFYHGE
jgi:ADP-ribose pyrophosphatase